MLPLLAIASDTSGISEANRSAARSAESADAEVVRHGARSMGDERPHQGRAGGRRPISRAVLTEPVLSSAVEVGPAGDRRPTAHSAGLEACAERGPRRLLASYGPARPSPSSPSPGPRPEQLEPRRASALEARQPTDRRPALPPRSQSQECAARSACLRWW